jgi:hypothetical protein
MAVIKKNKGKVRTRIPIDRSMRDYSNDPVFVRKAEEATAFLKEHGLPKEIEERIKKKTK